MRCALEAAAARHSTRLCRRRCSPGDWSQRRKSRDPLDQITERRDAGVLNLLGIQHEHRCRRFVIHAPDARAGNGNGLYFISCCRIRRCGLRLRGRGQRERQRLSLRPHSRGARGAPQGQFHYSGSFWGPPADVSAAIESLSSERMAATEVGPNACAANTLAAPQHHKKLFFAGRKIFVVSVQQPGRLRGSFYRGAAIRHRPPEGHGGRPRPFLSSSTAPTASPAFMVESRLWLGALGDFTICRPG